jgi:hypothetical protein
MVVDRLKKAGPPKFANPPNFTAPDDPHGVLASLNLPVYLTTNYDDFMFRALRAAEKDPRREVCRWHSGLSKIPSVFETEPTYRPSPANPLVFHLHGYDKEPDSIVLTEDDYLKFMINLARDPALLPPLVQAAISASTLLFVGYRLADWNFRVLFQMLRPDPLTSVLLFSFRLGLTNLHLRRRSNIDEYYGAMNLKMFWGTAREFSSELRRRWAEFRASAER